MIIPGEDYTINNDKKNLEENTVIKNIIEENYGNKNLLNNEQTVISGSNYGNFVPSAGVQIRQGNQSKQGSLNFNNQFGRMSMKEYEQLRDHYLRKNDTVGNNVSYENKKTYDFRNNNWEVQKNINVNSQKEEISPIKIVDDSNYFEKINDTNEEGKVIYNKLPKKANSNMNINSYNNNHLSPNENNSMNILMDNNENVYKSSNGKVLNENLFKKKTFAKRGSYKPFSKNSTKSVISTFDINKFNNQVMNNKNWGN